MDARTLANMNHDEIRKMFDRSMGICIYAKCGKPVMSSQERRVVPAGVYHEDCYFEAWGEEVEAHPISGPRRGIGGSNLGDLATA